MCNYTFSGSFPGSSDALIRVGKIIPLEQTIIYINTYDVPVTIIHYVVVKLYLYHHIVTMTSPVEFDYYNNVDDPAYIKVFNN